MPGFTSPDTLPYPVTTDPDKPTAYVAALATAVQNALTSRDGNHEGYTYRWPTITERNAEAGMRSGDIGFQENNRLYYQYNGSAWRAIPGQRIVPSSIAGATVALDANTGIVTFTAASSIEVRGAFPSDFRNYRVVIEQHNATADTGGQLTLMNGTVPDTATQYNAVTGFDVGTTRTIGAGNGQTYFPTLGLVLRSAVMDMKLYAVTDASVSTFYRNEAEGFITANIVQQSMSGRYLTAKAHDGFRITTTANISGRIYVEGID